MLNDQDRMKVLLLRTLVEKEGRDLPKEDILWALEKLERAAYSRPDDFSFPEYAALVNPIVCNAFRMKSVGKPDWQCLQELPEGILAQGVQVYRITIECPAVNAFLVVRPWIRVHADTTNAAFEQLRRCTVTLTVSREKESAELLTQSPIDDYLIMKDGMGVRSLSPILKDKPPTFPACRFTTNLRNPGPEESMMTMDYVDPKQPLGIFCAGGSVINLEIRGPQDLKSDPMAIIAGLVVMEYSTKP